MILFEIKLNSNLNLILEQNHPNYVNIFDIDICNDTILHISIYHKFLEIN